MVGPAANPWELQFREHPPNKKTWHIWAYQIQSNTKPHLLYRRHPPIICIQHWRKNAGNTGCKHFCTLLLYLSHDDPDSDRIFSCGENWGRDSFLANCWMAMSKAASCPIGMYQNIWVSGWDHGIKILVGHDLRIMIREDIRDDGNPGTAAWLRFSDRPVNCIKWLWVKALLPCWTSK